MQKLNVMHFIQTLIPVDASWAVYDPVNGFLKKGKPENFTVICISGQENVTIISIVANKKDDQNVVQGKILICI